MSEPNIFELESGVSLIYNDSGSVTIQLPFPFPSREYPADVVQKLREWIDAQQKSVAG